MIDANESANHPGKDRKDNECPFGNECSRQEESRHRDKVQENYVNSYSNVQPLPDLSKEPKFGHRRAAMKFIEKFQPMIEGIARSFARTQGMQMCDAENLAQETMLSILKKEDDAIELIQNPSKYLRAMVKNLRITIMRRTEHERIGIPHLELLEDLATTKEIDVDAQLVWEELINNCNQQEREILQLVYVENMTQKKVAELIGMSRTTLAHRINSIKKIAMSILM